MAKTKTAPRAADLLLEIGTEELPAAYLPGLIDQLRAETQRLLETRHLASQRIEVYGAPRRLVLIVKGLAGLQHKPAEEVRGPSKQAAFDAAGKPTPALAGFLRSQGGALAQTKLVASPKGEYVYLIKPPTTTPTTALLPALLTELIGRLRAPKAMRWDATGVRFARPVRWLLALYGTAAIRCSYGDLTGGLKTRIGRPQSLKWVSVTSLDGYLRTIKGARIILDQAQRREWIERTVSKAAKTFRGTTAPEMISHGLLDEVTYLTEEPREIIGSFDEKYLALPREVLLASMAKYQRVFSIEAGNKLLPRFIGILEGPPKQPLKVRAVMERILNARLADSLLFWEQDRKRPFAQLTADLAGVTFHEKIGSMADKAQRVHKLASVLEDAWKLNGQELSALRRASELAKADLVTTLVREFPTLQGVMGKHYALAAAELPEVAQAIEEHYLPLADKMPKTLIGSALSILDKYDTLASYFSIGITPTGDQDPFGLRRAAQGIVEVGWAIHRPLPLQSLFSTWQTASPKAQHNPALALQIQQYLLERWYTFAWPKPAPPVDCIEAVMEIYRTKPCDDLVDAMDRVQTLQRLAGQPSLVKAAKVIERTRNILKGAKRADGAVQPDLFKEPLEQALWQVYDQHKERVAKLITDRHYDKATHEFGELFYEPLHKFFDKVLVNDPDEALQRNRLALMRAIHTLYTERVADLSKLTVLQREESS